MDGMDETRRRIQLRPYQTKLVEIAKKQNTIVCLPTGAGKTVISMELMTDYGIRCQVKAGKKIVFVVTTVQLAEQQGKAIKEYTGYRVLVCTSNTTSGWAAARWQTEIQLNDVFVMIAQIFYEKLLANFMQFQSMALLTLDECHNATKAHAMSEIMDLYREFAGDSCPASPRVLGLTATINKAKIKDLSVEGIKLQIEKLEWKMQCKAVGADNQEEVERFSTSSNVEAVLFPENHKPLWKNLIDGITKLSASLGTQNAPHSLPSVLGFPVDRFPNFKQNNVFQTNKHEVRRELNNFLVDVLETYNALGPLACCYMIESKLSWLESLKVKDQHRMDALNIAATETQLMLFQLRVMKLVEENEKVKPVNDAWKDFISHKAEVLLNRLKTLRQDRDSGNASNSDETMLGLIFVCRRSFAAALKLLLQTFAAVDRENYGFIRPEIVTGTNNMRKDGANARVSPMKQKHVMERFRNKDVNIIICTTVLEEGIDVPQCNVVVRFDEIQGYTSFIQSMGRARKRNAKYLVMMPVPTSADGHKKLDSFMRQHRVMNELLPRNVTSEDIQSVGKFPEIDHDSEEEDDPFPDFTPFGPTGPKIKSASAISIVQRYVQRNLKRKILSWWTAGLPDPVTRKSRFRGYLYISESSDVPSVVEGPIANSKDSAKRGVHLEVCKLLLNAGALDHLHLLPK